MFAHETGTKSLFKLADIYLFNVSNRNTNIICDCVISMQSSDAYLQPSWKF